MEKGHYISSSALEPLPLLLPWDDVMGMIFICQIRKLYWNNQLIWLWILIAHYILCRKSPWKYGRSKQLEMEGGRTEKDISRSLKDCFT